MSGRSWPGRPFHEGDGTGAQVPQTLQGRLFVEVSSPIPIEPGSETPRGTIAHSGLLACCDVRRDPAAGASGTPSGVRAFAPGKILACGCDAAMGSRRFPFPIDRHIQESVR